MEKQTYKTDPRAYVLIEDAALDAYQAGQERIAVKALMEQVRATGLQVNNSDSAAIARKLIENHPRLSTLIETRALGTRGKNKSKRVFTVADLRRAFAMGMQYANLENRTKS